MIDDTALSAYPFRTASFKLGDALDYHWEALTDGGATLVRDIDRLFVGAIHATEAGRWMIERDHGYLRDKLFYSRDAAFYALASAVAERNAEYAANVAAWEVR